jgi:hydroxyacid-oxoacid transhydrogenase
MDLPKLDATNCDNVFEMSASRIRFGSGATREVGMELADLRISRVLFVVDAAVKAQSGWDVLRDALDRERIAYDVFDRVRVEPSETSFRDAIETAQRGDYQAFVALGGGSTIDTAKVANLYSTYPAEFLTYFNAPVGEARPIPGPLKPLIAIPTTAGTGSETTGVAICDLKDQRIKTGIAHRLLKPTLGILDPDHLRSLPPAVAASAGLDVLCHALESYTAIPYDRRPRPARPSQRPNYQGANPVSDVWVEKSLAMVRDFLPRLVRDPDDATARAQMLLAASFAGIGFGNAGVHLCHAMSYPIASHVRSYQPAGYSTDHPLVPHGVSVVLTAPAVFAFTAMAAPERHRQSLELLGAPTSSNDPQTIAAQLAEVLTAIIAAYRLPNGLSELGYQSSDIPQLVAGTRLQERLMRLAPCPVSDADLHRLFERSMRLW